MDSRLRGNDRGMVFVCRSLSESNLFVGWVSGSVTHADVGFHASTQPTGLFYLIASTYLGLRI
jgi:hypothetical protein